MKISVVVLTKYLVETTSYLVNYCTDKEDVIKKKQYTKKVYLSEIWDLNICYSTYMNWLNEWSYLTQSINNT